MVQTAAVLGREFDTQVLAVMLDGDDELTTKIGAADEAAVWSAMGKARYLFRHALLRDAAYEMQLRARLRSLHGRAAAAIEQVYAAELPPRYAELVYHNNQHDAEGEERRYAQLAGDYAAEQYANDEAVRFFGRALSLTESTKLAERADLLLKREGIHYVRGDRQAQAADIDELEAISQTLADAQVQAQVAYRRGLLARVTGEHEACMAHFQESIAAAQACGDVETETAANLQWGRSLWQSTQYAASREILEQAAKSARRTNNHEQEAQSLYDLAVLHFYQAEHEAARRQLTLAIEQYQKCAKKDGEANCLLLYGLSCFEQGRYREARIHFDRGLNICRAIGWRHGETYLWGAIGNNDFDIGSYEHARENHLRALKNCRELNDREGEAISLDTLGLIAYVEGDYRQAQRLFRDARHIQQSIGDHRAEVMTLTHLGYASVYLKDLIQAQTSIEQAVKISEQADMNVNWADALACRALLEFTTGDSLQACNTVRTILAGIEDIGVDAIELPAQVYLLCYQILAQAAASDSAVKALAYSALHDGYQLVHERAMNIQEPDLRQQFLENVPFNCQIVRLWNIVSQTSIPWRT